MTKSIFVNDSKEKCYLCGKYGPTEFHHIFFGRGIRNLSEKYGLKIHLCHWCHNEPPNGVHHNRDNDIALKQETQKKAMEIYGWSKEDFIKIFGKNYL